MDYEFIRGDTKIIGGFQLVDEDGNILKLDDTDELYFTVKKNSKKNDFVLQKRFSKGEIKYQNGVYYTILEHEDTAKLKYGAYEYDFQLVSGELVKTPISGTITLTDEITHISNE